jgi:hypothetical protein
MAIAQLSHALLHLDHCTLQQHGVMDGRTPRHWRAVVSEDHADERRESRKLPFGAEVEASSPPRPRHVKYRALYGVTLEDEGKSIPTCHMRVMHTVTRIPVFDRGNGFVQPTGRYVTAKYVPCPCTAMHMEGLSFLFLLVSALKESYDFQSTYRDTKLASLSLYPEHKRGMLFSQDSTVLRSVRLAAPSADGIWPVCQRAFSDRCQQLVLPNPHQACGAKYRPGMIEAKCPEDKNT